MVWWNRKCDSGGWYALLLSTLWIGNPAKRAFLLKLWLGRVRKYTDTGQTAGKANRRPPDCGRLPRFGTGERVGHCTCAHSGCRGLLFLWRTGGRRVSGRMDRHPRRANRDAGTVSSECMSEVYESNGARLSFRENGAGLPVVFLHPTPLDHYYWMPMMEELGGIRAILPDLRGHGASELGTNLPVGGFTLVPDAPVLSMAQMAADTLKLLDHLEIQQAVFAGCSIGGYVLLELWGPPGVG